jgi:hypothetical protein
MSGVCSPNLSRYSSINRRRRDIDNRCASFKVELLLRFARAFVDGGIFIDRGIEIEGRGIVNVWQVPAYAAASTARRYLLNSACVCK